MAFLRSVSRCNSALASKHILCGGVSSRSALARNDVQVIGLPEVAAVNQVFSRFYSTPKDPLDTTFNNAKDSFKSKTTWELVRGYLVYTICSSQYLVDNNLKVILILSNNR